MLMTWYCSRYPCSLSFPRLGEALGKGAHNSGLGESISIYYISIPFPKAEPNQLLRLGEAWIKGIPVIVLHVRSVNTIIALLALFLFRHSVRQALPNQRGKGQQSRYRYGMCPLFSRDKAPGNECLKVLYYTHYSCKNKVKRILLALYWDFCNNFYSCRRYGLVPSFPGQEPDSLTDIPIITCSGL